MKKKPDLSNFSFVEGFAIDSIHDHQITYGFIDSKGNKICEFKYHKVENFHNGLALVGLSKEGYPRYYYGFINTNGSEICNLKYHKVSRFFDGLSIVQINEHYGLLDSSGNEKVPVKYEKINYIGRGLFALGLKKRWSIINKYGKITSMIEKKYLDISFLENDLAVARGLNNRCGIIKNNGKEVIPTEYASIEWYSAGIYRADIQDNVLWPSIYVYINFEGYIFKNIYGLSEFRRLFYQNNTEHDYITAGYFNSNGKLAIPCKFDWGGHFYKGRTFVGSEGKTLLINNKGEVEKSLPFDSVGFLDNGYAIARKDKHLGIIDYKGNEVLDFKFGNIKLTTYAKINILKLEIINEEPYFVTMNNSNNEVIGKYKFVGEFYSGRARFQNLSENWGYIDLNGHEVIEAKYYDAEDFDYKNKASVRIDSDNSDWVFIDNEGNELYPDNYHGYHEDEYTVRDATFDAYGDIINNFD